MWLEGDGGKEHLGGCATGDCGPARPCCHRRGGGARVTPGASYVPKCSSFLLFLVPQCMRTLRTLLSQVVCLTLSLGIDAVSQADMLR